MHHGSPVCLVVSFEVLHNHFGHTFGLAGIRAGVTHRATATIQILPHHHRHLPHTRVAACRARRYHTVVEDFIVKGVRPRWWAILVDRQRWVVGKVGIVEHLVHFIAADWEEWCAHAAHIGQLHTTIGGENFALTGDLTRPFLLRELFTETVTAFVNLVDAYRKQIR